MNKNIEPPHSLSNSSFTNTISAATGVVSSPSIEAFEITQLNNHNEDTLPKETTKKLPTKKGKNPVFLNSKYSPSVLYANSSISSPDTRVLINTMIPVDETIIQKQISNNFPVFTPKVTIDMPSDITQSHCVSMVTPSQITQAYAYHQQYYIRFERDMRTKTLPADLDFSISLMVAVELKYLVYNNQIVYELKNPTHQDLIDLFNMIQSIKVEYLYTQLKDTAYLLGFNEHPTKYECQMITPYTNYFSQKFHFNEDANVFTDITTPKKHSELKITSDTTNSQKESVPKENIKLDHSTRVQTFEQRQQEIKIKQQESIQKQIDDQMSQRQQYLQKQNDVEKKQKLEQKNNSNSNIDISQQLTTEPLSLPIKSN